MDWRWERTSCSKKRFSEEDVKKMATTTTDLGALVGIDVTGALVGVRVTGAAEGFRVGLVGDLDGRDVVGVRLGEALGLAWLGLLLGLRTGLSEGRDVVGLCEGTAVRGLNVGDRWGLVVGRRVGFAVGDYADDVSCGVYENVLPRGTWSVSASLD